MRMKERVAYLTRWVLFGSVYWSMGLCLCSCSDGKHPKAASHAPDVGEAAPQRIVCGSPAITEIVFALGCADRVVGVSDYSTHPPEATDKAGIGGWANPNRERLLVLKPDIIVTQGKHETLASFAKEYGIRFHAVKLDTLEDVYTAIASIAGALHVADGGAELTGRIRGAIGSVRQKVAGAQAKRVLLLFGRAPGTLTGLSTVGPGTFLDELIGIGGGTNVFGDAKGAYPQVSKESLLIRKPEVILEINPGGLLEETEKCLRTDWREFDGIPAVQSGSIYYLTNDFLLIPGPRVGQAVSEIAEAIHPEPFRE